MAIEKLGVATEPSSGSLPKGSFALVQWGLTFWNLNKHHCFILLHITIWGAWSFVSEGLSLPKPPWRRDCVAKLQLAYNAVDSKKYLGYAICQAKACKTCHTFCL